MTSPDVPPPKPTLSDGGISTTYPDGTTTVRYPDGGFRSVDPHGWVTSGDAKGVVTTTPPVPQPRRPTSPPGTRVDGQNNLHTVRIDGTEEITRAHDGQVTVLHPDGSMVEHPPLPPRPVPAPGQPTTFHLTGTDGTVLEITPGGERTLIQPGGYREHLGPGPAAPPVITYDDDGTQHIHAGDGTHTIVEDGVRTVIPPRPLTPSAMADFEHDHIRSNGFGAPQPDGSTTYQPLSGSIENVRPDGTRVIHEPPLPVPVAPTTDAAPAKPPRGCSAPMIAAVVAILTITGVAAGLALSDDSSEDEVIEAATPPELTFAAIATTPVFTTLIPSLETTTLPAPETTIVVDLDATTLPESVTTIAPETTLAPEITIVPETTAPIPVTTAAPRSFTGTITSVGGEPLSPTVNEIAIVVANNAMSVTLQFVQDTQFMFTDEGTDECIVINLDTTGEPLPVRAGDPNGQLLSDGAVTLSVGVIDNVCSEGYGVEGPLEATLSVVIEADGSVSGTILANDVPISLIAQQV